LQAKADQTDVISLAMQEYKRSGTQVSVFQALEQAIQKYNKDHAKLQQIIIDIILNNRMCKLIFFNVCLNIE